MATLTTEAPAPVTAPPHRRARVHAWQAIYVIWYRDLLRYWRDRTRLAASLAQPVLFLVVFGVGLGSSLGGGFGGGGGLSYVQFMYPGIVGMAVLFTAIFSAMSIVWDREFGFLREILVAPISRSSVAIGKALGGATQAMLQGVIMLVFAPFVGVKLTLLSVVELVPLLFLLAFSLTALGVALGARMKSMQGFQVVMNFLLMPMFFLSGAMFPINGLPSWMTVLTRFDPVAYGMAPVRAVVLEGAGMPSSVIERISAVTIGGHALPILADVAVLGAFGLVLLAIAMRAFAHRD